MASGGRPCLGRSARVPDGACFLDLQSITRAGVCSVKSWRASGRILDSIAVLEVHTAGGTVYDFGVDGVASDRVFASEQAAGLHGDTAAPRA